MSDHNGSQISPDAPCDIGATSAPSPASDLLYGVPSIAEHLGLSERQARHLCERGSLPTFKLPGSAMICARRSSLDTCLATAEAAAKHRPPLENRA